MLNERKEGFTTTFWDDFGIADAFGPKAVEDTYRRAFRAWKSDYLYLTDLVVVLNHKLWQHYQAGREGMARLYDRLWREAQQYAYDNLKGEELKYFIRVID